MTHNMTWLWCSIKPDTVCPVALMTIFSMPRTGCSCSCCNIARCFLANTFPRFVTSVPPRLVALTLRFKPRSFVWTVFILTILFDAHIGLSNTHPRLIVQSGWSRAQTPPTALDGWGLGKRLVARPFPPPPL